MTTLFDPVVSEFSTQEQAHSYDQWFRRQVQQALESKHPTTPHDEVMADIDAILTQAEVSAGRPRA